MFFRIWFLYICKLCLAIFAFLLVVTLAPRTPFLEQLRSTAHYVLLVFAGVGALLAIPYVILRRKMACPICYTQSEVVVYGQLQPGVECPRCGDVYCKNLAISMQILIAPPDDEQRNPPSDSE